MDIYNTVQYYRVCVATYKWPVAQNNVSVCERYADENEKKRFKFAPKNTSVRCGFEVSGQLIGRIGIEISVFF